MSDLDLSAALAFDSSGAVRGAEQLAGATDQVDAAQTKAKGSARGLEAGSRSLAEAQSAAMRATQAERDMLRSFEQQAGRATTATNRITAAAAENIRMSRNQQFAIRNAGQQFGDFGLQVASGQNPIIAFQQQIGQLGYALGTLETGALASVGKFLVGPWGIALTVGAAVLAPFVAKLFEGNNALAEGVEKLKKDAAQTELTRLAREAFTKTIQGEIIAQRALNDELDRSIRTQRIIQQNNLRDAQQGVANLQRDRPGVVTSIAAQQRTVAERLRLLNQPGGNKGTNDPYGLNQSEYDKAKAKLDALQVQLAHIDAQIAGGLRGIREAQVPLIQNDVEAQLDKNAAAVRRYEIALGNLNQQLAIGAGNKETRDFYNGDGTFTPRVVSGISPQEYSRQLKIISDQRKADEKAARDAAAAANRKPDYGSGRVINEAEARRIVAGIGGTVTSGFRSRADQERIFADKLAGRHNGPVAVPGTSAHERGEAVDVAYGAGISIASIREAFAKEGVKLRKIFAEPGQRVFHVEFGKVGGTKKPREDTATPRDAEQIKAINEQFDRQPSLVDRAAAATRKLDAIIADLSKRKPPGFAQLIADAQKAKGTIQDGMLAPLRDFISAQNDTYEVNKLILSGDQDQADALKIIQRIEADRGPLNERQRDAVLATVQGLREQQRELDRIRQSQQKYVEALGGIKKVVEDATQAFVRGDLGQLLKSPKKLLDVFQTLQGQKLFDKVFGGLFQDLQDQASGVKPIKDASKKMAQAVDYIIGSVRESDKAIASLATAADSAASALSGIPGAANDNAPTGFSPGVTTKAGQDLFDALTAAFGGGHGSSTGTHTHPDVGDSAGGDIVVTGTTGKNTFEKALGGIAESILKLFTNPDTAKSIGGAIGKYAGIALEGAATGQFVSGIAKTVGIKLNSTGSQIGGAIGSVAGAASGIPGGQQIGAIIGSIQGGIIGNLFAKPKYGTASLTSQGTPPNIAGSGKNGRGEATTLGAAVQNGIQAIVDQLGGQLGNYAVSIGTFKDNYRVSTTGFSGSLDSKKAKGQGLVDFGKDGADAAIAFAIRDAIADGAVQGLSAAVQRALASSTDLDKALKEALDVQQLESLLGGAQGAIDQIFKAEAATAANRLRLARTYGLDIAKVEKLNADERTKLIADTLKNAVGSLQDVLTDLATGDLFEGTAADRRQALLAKIADLTPKAKAGESGAADQLAALYRQLYSTTRDAYGTAGPELGSDRSLVQTGAQAIIQAEQDRIDAALAAQNATTSAVNETNDLLAITNASLAGLPANIAANLAKFMNGGVSFDTGRLTDLAA